MPENFRQRFLNEAGEHPYAWVVSLGLPKDLVSAVMRGGDDYRPIRRTLTKLAEATGKSEEWWLTGSTDAAPTQQVKNTAVKPAARAQVVATIGSGGIVDPVRMGRAERALEEWARENDIVVDPERRGAIIAVLYNYLLKGADSGELGALLKIVR